MTTYFRQCGVIKVAVSTQAHLVYKQISSYKMQMPWKHSTAHIPHFVINSDTALLSENLKALHSFRHCIVENVMPKFGSYTQLVWPCYQKAFSMEEKVVKAWLAVNKIAPVPYRHGACKCGWKAFLHMRVRASVSPMSPTDFLSQAVSTFREFSWNGSRFDISCLLALHISHSSRKRRCCRVLLLFCK